MCACVRAWHVCICTVYVCVWRGGGAPPQTSANIRVESHLINKFMRPPTDTKLHLHDISHQNYLFKRSTA